MHALGCVVGREVAEGWLPHLNATFGCSRTRAVREYCDAHRLPITVAKVPSMYSAVFRSDPLGFLLSGAVMGNVLLVETPGTPAIRLSSMG